MNLPACTASTRLYALGSLAALAAESFGAGAQAFGDAPSLTAALGGALATSGPEVRLLVKGSRVNRLERVVDALTGGLGASQGGH